MDGSETIGNTAVGTWTILEGGGVFEDPFNEHTYVSGIPVGVNVFQWTVDNGMCGVTTDEVTVTIYDPELAAANAGSDLEICEDDFLIFNLQGTEVEFPATGAWTIVSGPVEIGDTQLHNATVWTLGEITSPLEPVVSELIWTVNNGVCGTTADTVVFTLNDCLTIEIPDGFSPNGDGINDFFEIPNLYKYPNNTLKIFNRWGALIYEAAPYQNNWDGKSHHPATIGEDLPVSTYYYILDLGDGVTEPFTGYIFLKR
jgi:gliding motility-associated-like protein